MSKSQWTFKCTSHMLLSILEYPCVIELSPENASQFYSSQSWSQNERPFSSPGKQDIIKTFYYMIISNKRKIPREFHQHQRCFSTGDTDILKMRAAWFNNCYCPHTRLILQFQTTLRKKKISIKMNQNPKALFLLIIRFNWKIYYLIIRSKRKGKHSESFPVCDTIVKKYWWHSIKIKLDQFSFLSTSCQYNIIENILLSVKYSH